MGIARLRGVSSPYSLATILAPRQRSRYDAASSSKMLLCKSTPGLCLQIMLKILCAFSFMESNAGFQSPRLEFVGVNAVARIVLSQTFLKIIGNTNIPVL